MRRAGHLLVAVGMLALAGAMLIKAFGFGDEARRIPIVAGVPVVTLLSVQVGREALALRRGAPATRATGTSSTEASMPGMASGVAPSSEHTSSAGHGPGLADSRHGASAPVALAWIVIFGAMVLLLGVVWTSVLFPPLFMLTQGKERILATTIVTVITVVMTQYAFIHLLGVQVFRGMLWGWLP